MKLQLKTFQKSQNMFKVINFNGPLIENWVKGKLILEMLQRTPENISTTLIGIVSKLKM